MPSVTLRPWSPERLALDRRRCDRARVARDARDDNRFFSGVLTTRIYCRPTCPVKPAKSRNVVFFRTAAASSAEWQRPPLVLGVSAPTCGRHKRDYVPGQQGNPAVDPETHELL